MLLELLEKIKFTGERGPGMEGKVFFGPEGLRKAEQLYKKKFGAIRATYQIYFCKGTK